MASSSSSFFGIEPLDGGETYRHAMDACSPCGKRLAGDRDIFMYRGDAPFCSEECRYHQIPRDDLGAGEDMRLKAERPAREEEQRRRREAPAAAEPARIPLASNVPVAI